MSKCVKKKGCGRSYVSTALLQSTRGYLWCFIIFRHVVCWGQREHTRAKWSVQIHIWSAHTLTHPIRGFLGQVSMDWEQGGSEKKDVCGREIKVGEKKTAAWTLGSGLRRKREEKSRQNRNGWTVAKEIEAGRKRWGHHSATCCLCKELTLRERARERRWRENMREKKTDERRNTMQFLFNWSSKKHRNRLRRKIQTPLLCELPVKLVISFHLPFFLHLPHLHQSWC